MDYCRINIIECVNDIGRSRISTPTLRWFRLRASTLRRKWRGTVGSAWRTFTRPRWRRTALTTVASGVRWRGRTVTVASFAQSSSPIFPQNQWYVSIWLRFFFLFLFTFDVWRMLSEDIWLWNRELEWGLWCILATFKVWTFFCSLMCWSAPFVIR